MRDLLISPVQRIPRYCLLLEQARGGWTREQTDKQTHTARAAAAGAKLNRHGRKRPQPTVKTQALPLAGPLHPLPLPGPEPARLRSFRCASAREAPTVCALGQLLRLLPSSDAGPVSAALASVKGVADYVHSELSGQARAPPALNYRYRYLRYLRLAAGSVHSVVPIWVGLSARESWKRRPAALRAA